MFDYSDFKGTIYWHRRLVRYSATLNHAAIPSF